MKLMRVVIREDFSLSRCDQLYVTFGCLDLVSAQTLFGNMAEYNSFRITDIKVATRTLDNMDKKALETHIQYVVQYHHLSRSFSTS